MATKRDDVSAAGSEAALRTDAGLASWDWQLRVEGQKSVMGSPGCVQLFLCRGLHTQRPRVVGRSLPLRVVAMVRNRGRLRDPDNSPLRDGNRDVLYGILTRRAARTLVYYLTETNQNMAQWLVAYFHKACVAQRSLARAH